MSVDPIRAGELLARLQAHFPSLAANTDAARDWIREIESTPDPYPIVDWMIREWDRDRSPRVSDWVRARRTSVHQAAIAAADSGTLAIEAPVENPVPKEKARELLSEASRTIASKGLDEARRPLVGVSDRREWSELRDSEAGLAVRPLTYDEVYGPEDPAPPVDDEDGS